jgi:hypothetical protein
VKSHHQEKLKVLHQDCMNIIDSTLSDALKLIFPGDVISLVPQNKVKQTKVVKSPVRKASQAKKVVKQPVQQASKKVVVKQAVSN